MKKEWYKTWWGKTLCILFFYILIPYLVWTQTNWNKYLKMGVTVICFLLFGYVIVTSILIKNLHDKLIKEVEKLYFIYVLGSLSEYEYDALRNNTKKKEIYKIIIEFFNIK